ncbi:MAG: hypothetical protein AAB628_02580 [Patescibacteria group bacterium]
MTTKILDFSNIDRKLFWILSGSIVFAVGFYLYSAFTLTFAVVERDRALSSARTIALGAAGLEQEYMALQNTVTLSFAEKRGFMEVAPKFTGGSSKPDTLALSR